MPRPHRLLTLRVSRRYGIKSASEAQREEQKRVADERAREVAKHKQVRARE
jgi:hypothetical protein